MLIGKFHDFSYILPQEYWQNAVKIQDFQFSVYITKLDALSWDGLVHLITQKTYNIWALEALSEAR